MNGYKCNELKKRVIKKTQWYNKVAEKTKWRLVFKTRSTELFRSGQGGKLMPSKKGTRIKDICRSYEEFSIYSKSNEKLKCSM